MEKADQYTREELEAVLRDEARVDALPTSHELGRMTPKQRARAADEIALQLHACAAIGGGEYSAEDLDWVMGQK